MKKFFFVLATFAASYSFASTTQITCNLVRLEDKGALVIGTVDLNCAQNDVKHVGTQRYGLVAFSCERVDGDIAVLVRLPQKNVTLSAGRTVSAVQASSFSSYFATESDALMVNCWN